MTSLATPPSAKPSSLDALPAAATHLSEGPGEIAAEQTSIQLPKVYKNWPWPRTLNPYYQEAKQGSNAWIRSFQCLSEKRQAKFEACDFSLAAALLWPRLDKSKARIACDLMNLYFMFDHFSDIGDGEEVQKQADIMKDALRNPFKPRPDGEVILGEMTRQFWANALQTGGIPPTSARRFVNKFGDYAQALATRAKDRDDGHVRSIQEYLSVRRLTIAVRPSLVLLEIPDVQDVSKAESRLPAEYLNDPTLEAMIFAITDMTILDNDVLSYNIEQARGDDAHNILTIVMRELNVDIHGALKWVEGYHANCERTFLENYQRLVPTFSDAGRELDGGKGRRLREYADGLGLWVVGHYSWCFESERYFGTEGPKIRREGIIKLLPKAAASGS
ncbi:hypothetical protein AX16_005066 [Volvariella volvacea WC 439]|nr:hypothetical protein AX16_005066 [Volvariella volvacea WC 439]